LSADAGYHLIQPSTETGVTVYLFVPDEEYLATCDGYRNDLFVGITRESAGLAQEGDTVQILWPEPGQCTAIPL
jgi:hypothetical protein